MKIRNYLDLHNELIPTLNLFLVNILDFEEIPLYQNNQYEDDPSKLPMTKVIDELNIIKLYEQYAHYDYIDNKRKDLKLSMFFENSIRLLLNKEKDDFHELIHDGSTVIAFNNYIMETNTRNADTLVRLLSNINYSRNQIRHDSDYTIDIEYNIINNYAHKVVEQLESRVEACDLSVFESSQSLYFHHLAFKELSFGYKYKYLQMYGIDILIDNDIFEYYIDDRAYQSYYIEKVMGGEFMKHISDFRKIEENISRFNNLVGELEHTNNMINDVLNVLGDISEAADVLNDINDKFKGMKKVNVSNLTALLKTQSDFPDNTNYEELYNNLSERINSMNEISKKLKNISTKVGKMENKIDSMYDQISRLGS
jgi:hypothetical protein